MHFSEFLRLSVSPPFFFYKPFALWPLGLGTIEGTSWYLQVLNTLSENFALVTKGKPARGVDYWTIA